MSLGVWPPIGASETPLPDQFRASLNRHIDKLIEEEDRLGAGAFGPITAHRYAASILRELKAWIETGS